MSQDCTISEMLSVISPKFKEVKWPWPCPLEKLFVNPKANTSDGQTVYTYGLEA